MATLTAPQPQTTRRTPRKVARKTPFLASQKPVVQKQWTYTEVAALDDENRYEIHDGELIQMPAPALLHQDIAFKIAHLLANWALTHGGKVFMAPVDFYVSETRYFQPDVAFYFAASLQNPEILADPKRLRVAPDLIVEVVSPSSRRTDRVRKVNAYAQYGVRHYWIIDPDDQTLEAHELRDALYTISFAGEGEENFSPAAFEGLNLELGTLWQL